MTYEPPCYVSYTIKGGRPFVITNDYTIDCQLGSGGSGVVCSGTHKMTEERVAIKQLFLDGRYGTLMNDIDFCVCPFQTSSFLRPNLALHRCYQFGSMHVYIIPFAIHPFEASPCNFEKNDGTNQSCGLTLSRF